MFFQQRRKVSAKTPVYDHAGTLHFHAHRERVQELIDGGNVEIIGTAKKIKGLRFKGPDPAHLSMSGSRHKRPIGTPHRNENCNNVRGVWHIDRIPDTYRPNFFAVVHGQLVLLEFKSAA